MRTSILLVALLAAPAAADPQRPKPKPIKAQFLCGTMVGSKVKQVITGGKVAKLSDPIACAIHMDDPKISSRMGTVRTVRYQVDAAKKRTKIETSGKTDDFGPDSTNKDFEIVMKPGVADANGEVLWKSCEDFDIVARISDDLVQTCGD